MKIILTTTVWWDARAAGGGTRVCVCVCVCVNRCKCSKRSACQYDVQQIQCIITDESRTYHVPCEIKSVAIDVSFTAWVIVAVVSVIRIVVVVLLAVVIVVVVVVL